MKKLFKVIALLLVVLPSKSQTIEYTITKNEPEFKNIPNLFFSPGITLDAPLIGAGGTDAMNASTLGWGIRSHAIIKEKFYVDANFMRSFWNVISNVDQKPMQIELGGAYLTNIRVTEKNMKVVLSREEISREHVTFENKVKVTERINYVNVIGNEMRFSGFRGGAYFFRSIFDYDIRDNQPNTPFQLDYDVTGYTDAIGVYGGITFGRIRNLHIQLKDGRKRAEMLYTRWYADLIIAPYKNTFLSTTPNNLTKFASPVGFRIGFDNTNKVNEGLTGKIIGAEVGYRPGYNGFYATFSISFLQVRKQIAAFN
jgi:hypothetical protein